MGDFQEQYCRAFEILGRPLRPEDSVPDEVFAAMEQELGVQIPKSLAEFSHIAGRAHDFIYEFNRLLHPYDWRIENGKLLFMGEFHFEFLWGTEAVARSLDDPPVFEARNEDPLYWYQVAERCSVFLLVMLHWQATFGRAMPFTNTAKVEAELVDRLELDWSFVGEVDGIKAFNKPGRAVCFREWDGGWKFFVGASGEAELRWHGDWRIFAGASGEAELSSVASELDVRWDDLHWRW